MDEKGRVISPGKLRAELRDKERYKKLDASLKLFATRIPAHVLERFTGATWKAGVKIQTIVKEWMIEYADKILKGEGGNE